MSAEALVREVERRFRGREAVLRLAWHAALPVAITPDLLHLMRLNFFSGGADTLPYEAEADLLLSPLCTPVGDDLFEVDPGARDVLLKRLFERYGPERLREMALLLWRYGERRQPWAGRRKLERAQQLTVLSALDARRAQEWLDLARTHGGTDDTGERAWLAAMSRELSRPLEPAPGDRGAQDDPPLVVICYDDADERFLDGLQVHLAPLVKARKCRVWHRGMLRPGQLVSEADRMIDAAQVVLLLVSADFFVSGLRWQEVERAMSRHTSGETTVIPVRLRPSYWEDAPFAKLASLPRNAEPVSAWADRDEAWREVARGILDALNALPRSGEAPAPSPGKLWLLHQNDMVVGRVLVLPGDTRWRTEEHWELFQSFRYPSHVNPVDRVGFRHAGSLASAEDFQRTMLESHDYFISRCERHPLDTPSAPTRLDQAPLPSFLAREGLLVPGYYDFKQNGSPVGRAVVLPVVREEAPRVWDLHMDLYPAYSPPSIDGKQTDLTFEYRSQPIPLADFLRDFARDSSYVVARCFPMRSR